MTASKPRSVFEKEYPIRSLADEYKRQLEERQREFKAQFTNINFTEEYIPAKNRGLTGKDIYDAANTASTAYDLQKFVLNPSRANAGSVAADVAVDVYQGVRSANDLGYAHHRSIIDEGEGLLYTQVNGSSSQQLTAINYFGGQQSRKLEKDIELILRTASWPIKEDDAIAGIEMKVAGINNTFPGYGLAYDRTTGTLNKSAWELKLLPKIAREKAIEKALWIEYGAQLETIGLLNNNEQKRIKEVSDNRDFIDGTISNIDPNTEKGPRTLAGQGIRTADRGLRNLRLGVLGYTNAHTLNLASTSLGELEPYLNDERELNLTKPFSDKIHRLYIEYVAYNGVPTQKEFEHYLTQQGHSAEEIDKHNVYSKMMFESEEFQNTSDRSDLKDIRELPIWGNIKNTGITVLESIAQAELQKQEGDAMVRDAGMDMVKSAGGVLRNAFEIMLDNTAQAQQLKQEGDSIVRDAGMDMWVGFVDFLNNKPYLTYLTEEEIVENLMVRGYSEEEARRLANSRMGQELYGYSYKTRDEVKEQLNVETPAVEPMSYNPSYSGFGMSKKTTGKLGVPSIGFNRKDTLRTQMLNKTGSKPGQVSKTNGKAAGSGLRSDKVMKNLEKSMGFMNKDIKKSNQLSAGKTKNYNSRVNTSKTKNIKQNSGVSGVNYNQAASGLSTEAAQSKNNKVYITGGSLDYINSIKSPIEIEEDKIQMLKDVAEREYNLKYAQVTPQMTVQFGDVRETADVNNILSAIEQMTADALKSSLIGGL